VAPSSGCVVDGADSVATSARREIRFVGTVQPSGTLALFNSLDGPVQKEWVMKWLAVVMGMVCLFAAPALGEGVDYTFEVVSGTMTVDMNPDGQATPDAVTVWAAGTFGMTIYQQSEAHVGASDTFVLGAADIYNAQEVEMSYGGISTSHIGVGSARVRDFAPARPGHIGPGGAAAIETDVYADIVLIYTGVMNTTMDTGAWSEEMLTFPLTITTSVQGSDTLTVNLGATYVYWIGFSAITQTLTLDLRIDIVGTAHVVPDPALGGLTALGIGGAAVWLRRRR